MISTGTTVGVGQPRARLRCSRAGHILHRCSSSNPAIHESTPSAVRNTVRCASSGFQDPNIREAAKRLSALFYKDSSDAHAQSSTAPQQLWSESHVDRPDVASTSNADGVDPRGRAPPRTQPPPLHDLPLWRADSVVFVGQQALLHVHTPHYVHMFGRLFASRDRPWYFGHVHLPSGSRNLGSPEWALCAPGSHAPTVGVLMEVNRAVRLEDGKLMVLATALCRIQVRQCLSETPYSRARVEILHEDELLESFHGTGALAALGAGPGGTPAAPGSVQRPEAAARVAAGDVRCTAPEALHSCTSSAVPTPGAPDSQAGSCNVVAADVPPLLRVAGSAAQAAATAAGWRWLDYEVFTARAAAWPGRYPVEGTDPHDTRRLVSDLVDHGVLSVVPFADGPVAGRWDLAALGTAAAAEATAAAMAAAALSTAAAEPEVEGTAADGRDDGEAVSSTTLPDAAALRAGAGTSSGVEDGGCVRAAADGTVPQRGGSGVGEDASTRAPPPAEPRHTPIQAPESSMTLGPRASGPGGGEVRTFSADGAGKDEEGLTGHTTYDLLLLESKLWDELDAMAVLQARARQQRLGLPLGLLQLRPTDELAAQQRAAAAPPSVVCQQQPSTLASASGDAPTGDRGEAQQVKTATSFDPSQQSSTTARDGVVASALLTPQELPQQGTAQPRVHPASDGLDVYAHPEYPLQRRIMRLSYAAAGIFLEAQDSAARQELLEMPSVRARLLHVLQRARKARSVLSAMAAVKTLKKSGPSEL